MIKNFIKINDKFYDCFNYRFLTQTQNKNIVKNKNIEFKLSSYSVI
jgi:hypothetical protein